MAFVETAYYVEGRPMSGVVCGGCGAELTVQEAEKDACGVCGWRISVAREEEARAYTIANDPDLKPWPPEALLW
jgi:DNA-directed RNA polymerase subunit RPC12/RpoP